MTEQLNPGPLQLATMDEIIAEIGRRHTGYVAIFEAPTPNARDDASMRKVAYGGSWSTAIGLVSILNETFREDLQRAVKARADRREELGS